MKERREGGGEGRETRVWSAFKVESDTFEADYASTGFRVGFLGSVRAAAGSSSARCAYQGPVCRGPWLGESRFFQLLLSPQSHVARVRLPLCVGARL